MTGKCKYEKQEQNFLLLYKKYVESGIYGLLQPSLKASICDTHLDSYLDTAFQSWLQHQLRSMQYKHNASVAILYDRPENPNSHVYMRIWGYVDDKEVGRERIYKDGRREGDVVASILNAIHSPTSLSQFP